jgi:hypothetical protein
MEEYILDCRYMHEYSIYSIYKHLYVLWKSLLWRSTHQVGWGLLLSRMWCCIFWCKHMNVSRGSWCHHCQGRCISEGSFRYTDCHKTCTSHKFGCISNIMTHFPLVLRLGMSGNIPPLSLYAFMVWTGKTMPFSHLCDLYLGGSQFQSSLLCLHFFQAHWTYSW